MGFENFLILNMIVIFPLSIPSRVILVVLVLPKLELVGLCVRGVHNDDDQSLLDCLT